MPPDTASPEPLERLNSAGWLLIGAGAISIVAGVLAIAYPDITLLAIAIIAGVNLMVLSALSLVDSFGGGQDGGSRALSAVFGVLGLIAGLVILRRPGETLLVILLVAGIWLVVSGVVTLIRSIQQRDQQGLQMIAAICEIVLGILILSLPDVTLRTVSLLIGIGFILRGGVTVYAGWQLKKASAEPAGRMAPAA